MYEVIDMVEPARLAEQQVFDVALQLDVFYPLEPHQLALVRAVKERRTQPLCLADSDCVPFGHFTDDLHVRVFVVQLRDAVETAAVDVLVRELPHHIERGPNIEFMTKNVGTLGTDILTICYISIG